MNLLKNIRFYVLSFNILLSFIVYFYYKATIPDSSQQTIKIVESYALLALLYLYLALLATPFTRFFVSFPWRGQYLHARRAIGVSTFYFGALHGSFAFFGLLGGFDGLGFLSDKYLIAITLSAASLVILTLMASTSFDYMVNKLSFPRWKMLHRFIYLAAVLVLIHALLLGSHFSNLSDVIPQILFVGIAFLLFLESIRFDNYLKQKYPALPSFGIAMAFVLMFIASCSAYLFFPPGPGGIPSLDIHAQHILLAQQAQQQANSPFSNIPGLANNPAFIGDRTKRYTVSFLHPDIIEASKDANLRFKIYDASSGNFVDLFSNVYTKPMHLIIVDSSLQFFNHIHPVQDSNGFAITTQFPHPGVFHLYQDFQPLGAIEQQFAVTLNVGTGEASISAQPASFSPDLNFTKTFGNYEVTLDFPKPLKAADISVGKQKLTFTIKDAFDKNPVTELKPYLAAYGHLVMVNEKTYDYIHVHPTNLTPPAPDSNGGPTVEFLPLGLYGPIKPGLYRVFAQFNPNNNLFVADFTVNIE